jgi:hypothetical protein
MPNLFRHLTCNSLFDPAGGVLKQAIHDVFVFINSKPHRGIVFIG